MAVFTDISDWTSAQDTAAANEIVLAYSERRQCVGDAAVDPLDAGDNAQDTAFWKGMQDWCESKCTSFVNDGVTIAGASSITMYTLSTWRTEAGIADGFRRATTWPTDWTDYADAAYSYGPIQAGDIRGPWIFEDLQKAFDALRWTWRLFDKTIGSDDTTANAEQKIVDGRGATGPSAVSDAESKWASGSFVGFGGTQPKTYYLAFMAIDATIDANGNDDFFAGLVRQRCDWIFANIPDHIEVDAELLLKPVIEFTGDNYNDVDGYGDGEYSKFDEKLNQQTDTLTFSKLATDTSPIPTSYTSPATPDTSYWTATEEYNTGGLVLKWSFSHTL